MNQDRELNCKSVLETAVTLGYSLLKCGAETYRVEDSCHRVLEAYGCQEIEIFAVANYIAVSFRSPQGKLFYGQRRVHTRSNNLTQLDLLNQETRKITQFGEDPEVAQEKIIEIMKPMTVPLWKQCFITGLVGISFTMMLGGSLRAGLVAFLVNVCLRLILNPLIRLETNQIFINILGGITVTLLAWPCHLIGLGKEYNLIVSGAFMYLFPGIALMNSVRDIVASDYIAGITRLMETVLVALSIAIGSSIAVHILRSLGAFIE